MNERTPEHEAGSLAEALTRLHNPPPETPRERMWARIDEARRDRRGVVRPDFEASSRSRPVWRLVAAAAAVLVLGVGIGRMTGPHPGSAPVALETPAGVVSETPAVAPAGSEPNDRLFRLAAADLFSRADVLLTDVKVRSCADPDLGEVPVWAGGMLLQTRLLLDSPVSADPEVRGLLEELELVLAQISGLSRDRCAQDMAWIKAGMQERSTLDRLRVLADSGAPGRAL